MPMEAGPAEAVVTLMRIFVMKTARTTEKGMKYWRVAMSAIAVSDVAATSPMTRGVALRRGQAMAPACSMLPPLIG